jgi:hypothetical protein
VHDVDRGWWAGRMCICWVYGVCAPDACWVLRCVGLTKLSVTGHAELLWCVRQLQVLALIAKNDGIIHGYAAPLVIRMQHLAHAHVGLNLVHCAAPLLVEQSNSDRRHRLAHPVLAAPPERPAQGCALGGWRTHSRAGKGVRTLSSCCFCSQ